jgi:hypothetical protein
MTDERNIWKSFDFSQKENPIYETLINQSEKLKELTENNLFLNIECIDAYLDDNNPKLVLIYKVYLISRPLKGYSLRILSICEYYENKNRFPVDVYADLSGKKYTGIENKKDFLDHLEKIFNSELERNKIIELYNVGENYKK